MKALFELFRRFDARRIFGFIRRLGGMSRPKVKCYDLRSTRALRVEGDIKGFRKKVIVYQISIHAFRVEGDLNISDLQMSYITFLSTPSGWRATELQDGQVMSLYISIHVLLTSILYIYSCIMSSVFSKVLKILDFFRELRYTINRSDFLRMSPPLRAWN